MLIGRSLWQAVWQVSKQLWLLSQLSRIFIDSTFTEGREAYDIVNASYQVGFRTHRG